MTQLEGLTILVDTARQMPETKHLARALKWADRRLDMLRERKRKRDQRRANLSVWEEVVRDKYIAGAPLKCCGCLMKVNRRA